MLRRKNGKIVELMYLYKIRFIYRDQNADTKLRYPVMDAI